MEKLGDIMTEQNRGIRRISEKVFGNKLKCITRDLNGWKVWEKTLKKLPNWKLQALMKSKASGWRTLPASIKNLQNIWMNAWNKGNTPKWMTADRAVLIQKDRSKGTAAGNYKPITCLQIIWKLLTSMPSEGIYRNLEDNDFIGE